jgi:hypothetical protein
LVKIKKQNKREGENERVIQYTGFCMYQYIKWVKVVKGEGQKLLVVYKKYPFFLKKKKRPPFFFFENI